MLAKTLQHPFSVITTSKLERAHVKKRAYMTTKALGRGVVELIRDTGDGQAWIFEEARSAGEPSIGQKSLRGRKMCAEEATHQCPRKNVQGNGQLPNGGSLGRRRKEDLEESPRTFWRLREIHRDTRHRQPLHIGRTVAQKHSTKLAPTSGFPYVDKRADTALPQRQNRACGSTIELRQQRDRRHPWKLTDHSSHVCNIRSLAHGSRNDQGACTVLPEITPHVLKRFPMVRVNDPHSHRIYTETLICREHRGHVRNIGEERSHLLFCTWQPIAPMKAHYASPVEFKESLPNRCHFAVT